MASQTAPAPPRAKLSQDTLYFPMPITTNVENTIELQNSEEASILFKVKTSAPDRYVVRPKVGMLYPKAAQRIRFVCIATAADSVSENTRDRFSVEIRFATKDDKPEDVAAAWAQRTPAGSRPPPIGHLEMKCRFLPPGTPVPDGVRIMTGSRVRASSTAHVDDASPMPSEVSVDHPPPPVHARAATNSFKPPPEPLPTAAEPVPTTRTTEVVPSRAERPSLAVLEPQPKALFTAGNDPTTAPAPSDIVAMSFCEQRTPSSARRRVSSFDRIVELRVPVIVVVPLMVLGWFLGAYSDHYAYHLETLFSFLQAVLDTRMALPDYVLAFFSSS